MNGILRTTVMPLLLALASPFPGAGDVRAQAASVPAADSLFQTGAPSPAALARAVLERFAAGSTGAFDSIYPFPRGRGLVAYAAGRDLPRRPGVGRVVWTRGDRAVLALSGHVGFGNSGDETIFAEGFSGLYEARRGEGGRWMFIRRLPLDSAGRIRAQALDVTLAPGEGLRVIDTLDIAVTSGYGFATRLNHAVRLSSVRLGGRPADFEFGGGLLWVRTPPLERARLVLEYFVDVARDSATGPNSGRFEQAYGHVRNQYFWHPRGEEPSRFTLTVRAPAGYRVATDLPQTDTVVGSVRTARARSGSPAPALSLFYDRDWQPQVRQAGRLRLAVFATPDFAPAPDSLAAAFARVHGLLGGRFGEPQGGYVAVVQGRARPGAGWLYLSNGAIVAATQGGALIQDAPVPRAYFGHEVAHGWTHPTGPAANFLSEGWATFAEALLLADQHGPEVEHAFWENQRNRYHTGGFEGGSILDDPLNSGIAYHKGAWIFRMLRHVMGEAAFRQGLRDYMGIAAGEPAGIEEFTAALSRARPGTGEFLRPWVEERAIPDLAARVEGARLIVAQSGPLFRLPLEVDLITPSGPVRRTVTLSQREDTLFVGDVGTVTDAVVDPDRHFLVRRRRGEVVRFELRAPGAKEVALTGDFTTRPLPATRQDGVWSVEVPLTAGRYLWTWTADDEVVGTGVRVVRPVRELQSAHPR